MEDLRDWLREVEGKGELRRIEGADWNLEIGAFRDPRVMDFDTSALLFDNIKGYPSGYRATLWAGM